MRAIPGPAHAYARPSSAREASCATTTTAGADSNARRQLTNIVRDAADDADDDAFATSAPWKLALEALDRTEFDAAATECRYNVGWIRRGGWRAGRAPRVVALVRDFGVTATGDGAGTLCDPTGEIRVIVHRELLTPNSTNSTVGGAGVATGCAVLLRDAPVVSVDGMTAHALVATRESLVAVFAAEDDADAIEEAKRCKAEREALRERLRETAAREAMDVEWAEDDDDECGAADAVAVDAGGGAGATVHDDSGARRDSVEPAVVCAEAPSASVFAMRVAALFDD